MDRTNKENQTKPWENLSCEKIKTYSRLVNYDINELAEKLGVSREYISRVFNGHKNNPLTDKLKRKFYEFYIEDIRTLFQRLPESLEIVSDVLKYIPADYKCNGEMLHNYLDNLNADALSQLVDNLVMEKIEKQQRQEEEQKKLENNLNLSHF